MPAPASKNTSPVRDTMFKSTGAWDQPLRPYQSKESEIELCVSLGFGGSSLSKRTSAPRAGQTVAFDLGPALTGKKTPPLTDTPTGLSERVWAEARLGTATTNRASALTAKQLRFICILLRDSSGNFRRPL